MQATPTSSINSNTNPNIRQIRNGLLSWGPWPPKRVSNRCPATILAARRIDSAPGRITFLTLSMITIIGIKGPGVPEGTKWAKTLLNWYISDISILPSHSGRPNVKVIERWLDLVKICGQSPMKFEKIININMEIKIEEVPGIESLPKTALNSLSIYMISILNDFPSWEFEAQNIWGIKKTEITAAAQFNGAA